MVICLKYYKVLFTIGGVIYYKDTYLLIYIHAHCKTHTHQQDIDQCEKN